MPRTVIFVAPAAHLEAAPKGALCLRYECSAIVDPWTPGTPLTPGAIHFTTAAPHPYPEGVTVKVVSEV